MANTQGASSPRLYSAKARSAQSPAPQSNSNSRVARTDLVGWRRVVPKMERSSTPRLQALAEARSQVPSLREAPPFDRIATLREAECRWLLSEPFPATAGFGTHSRVMERSWQEDRQLHGRVSAVSLQRR